MALYPTGRAGLLFKSQQLLRLVWPPLRVLWSHLWRLAVAMLLFIDASWGHWLPASIGFPLDLFWLVYCAFRLGRLHERRQPH